MKINWPNIWAVLLIIVIYSTAIFFFGRWSKKEKECPVFKPLPIEEDTIRESMVKKQDSIFKVDFKKLPKETQEHYRYLIDSLTPWTNER